jgi:hypothetical protein
MSAWGTRHRARYGLTTARPQKPGTISNAAEGIVRVPIAPLDSQLPRLIVAGQEMPHSKAS